MPKVSVYKYNDAGAGEDHVRTAGQGHDVRAIPQSSTEGIASNESLGRGVFASDPRHVPTSLNRGEVVNHASAWERPRGECVSARARMTHWLDARRRVRCVSWSTVHRKV